MFHGQVGVVSVQQPASQHGDFGSSRNPNHSVWYPTPLREAHVEKPTGVQYRDGFWALTSRCQLSSGFLSCQTIGGRGDGERGFLTCDVDVTIQSNMER